MPQFGGEIATMDHTIRRNIDYLDRYVPLCGASHAAVISYSVDIPMRYAECRADLGGGRIARLADKRQFLGWSGHEPKPALLFACDRQLIVLQTGPQPAATRARLWQKRTFIGVDGELLKIDHWRLMELRCWTPTPQRHRTHLQPDLATDSPTLMR